LSLTSSNNDSVLYVATHPRNTTLSTEDTDYAQRAYVNNVDGGSGANLYIHDRTLAAAGTDSADHTNGGTDWDMAGIVINPDSSSGATWAANEDTKLTGLATETTKRLRFLVDNSGTAGSGAVSYELQVAETATCSGGSYTAVDSDSHWTIADSTYVTDGNASENVSGGLTDPGGSSWVAGELEDSADSTDAITLAADEFIPPMPSPWRPMNLARSSLRCRPRPVPPPEGITALSWWKPAAAIWLLIPPMPRSV
jgi:hypothetical protein